jgi:hypothetical protein
LRLWSIAQLAIHKEDSSRKTMSNVVFKQQRERKWIGDYLEREPALAKKGVEVTKAAFQQEQEDMNNAKYSGLRNREAEKTFQERIDSIRNSLSHLTSSDNGENKEAGDDDETEEGQLSEDDAPGWVIGTITKMVQRQMQRFW